VAGGGRWCSWTRQVVRDGVGGFATTMDGSSSSSSGERRERRGSGSDLFEARSSVPEVVLVLHGHVAVTAVPYAAGADDMIREMIVSMI
jgi:hypothetical protein